MFWWLQRVLKSWSNYHTYLIVLSYKPPVNCYSILRALIHCMYLCIIQHQQQNPILNIHVCINPFLLSPFSTPLVDKSRSEGNFAVCQSITSSKVCRVGSAASIYNVCNIGIIISFYPLNRADKWWHLNFTHKPITNYSYSYYTFLLFLSSSYHWKVGKH